MPEREPPTLSLELDEEQLEGLQILPDTLHPGLKCLRPVLESIRQAYTGVKPSHRAILPVRHATDFETTASAAMVLGVDYESEDISYMFESCFDTEQLQESPELYENFAALVKDLLRTGNYVTVQNHESFGKTVLDLVILDRLPHLGDKDPFERLQVSSHVPVSIRIRDTYGNAELVKGHVDWAIGYGVHKSRTGAILVILEAKHESPSVRLPQLLACMTPVHQARKLGTDGGVFGMLSDGNMFTFAWLNETKKFFGSRQYRWVWDRPKIIAYIDLMLIKAIESSPHSLPQRYNSRALTIRSGVGRNEWHFADEPEFEEAEDENEQYGKADTSSISDQGEEGEDNGMVDVVNIGGRVVLRASKHRETLSN